MKRILLIAGTRPNFIKLAPLYHRLKSNSKFQTFICHTGQHFDFNMSDVFWQNLALPEPDFKLDIKGNGVVEIIGKTILGLNDVIANNPFDIVVVFGDVNATVAGAITAAQTGIKLVHVEAGLRSFDRTMPEEVNRVITDHVSDYLMVSEPSGIENLKHEGFKPSQYLLVGNIMIESLLKTKHSWENIELQPELNACLKAKPVVCTFHRPENVDSENCLTKVVRILKVFAENRKVIFPIHPRTNAKLKQYGLYDELQSPNILLSEPLSYFSFLKVIVNAEVVITDSGGIQEETSFLNIPCVTFRKNTERPITLSEGTNILLDINDDDFMNKIETHIHHIRSRKPKMLSYWDDKVSERIIDFIEKVI